MKRLFPVILFLSILSVIIGCSGDAGRKGLSPGENRDTSNEDINTTDEFGRIPLHYAALRGQKDTVRQLLEQGAKVNTKDKYSFTPLHYAARRGHNEVVRLLLSKKAELNTRDHYFCTPLHHAAARRHLEIVKLLLDAGADLEAKDKNGQSPANLAYDEGYMDLAGLLDPLTHAVKSANLEGLKTLLEKDPRRLNAKDWAGRTPLHNAFHYDQTAIRDFLKAKGADQNIKDKFGKIPGDYSPEKKKRRTGVNRLDTSFAARIDNNVYEKLHEYSFVNIGLVFNGEVVFTRSYGNNGVNNDYVYASISKSITATIIMQLKEQGKIHSLDDDIREYSPRYKNCMPGKYADSPLTIRHLLMFKSGVPHNNRPTWKNGKLNLKFKPGTKSMYSTPGYGILGHVIEDVTGMSFDRAVKEYIGKPVGATSFWAEKVFKAPGARIHSTIKDMALMITGVMNNKYVSPDMLYNRILQHDRKDLGFGIGWPCRNLNTPDITALSSGSNGFPQAYLIFKPKKKLGVVILARAKDRHSFELGDLCENLFSTLENQVKSKGKIPAPGAAAPVVPGKKWFKYASPGEAGWSPAGLEKAGEYFNTLGSAAVMVIYRGAVLAAWGDIQRRYMCHSVRKSYMSALYGIYVEKGIIDPDKTLRELSIDDIPPLTETEKNARVIDLLRARSGVFHKAAFETASMKRARPKRGSHAPGTFWYYNNWDFNTLCTIFEKETGKKFFEEFKKQVADPLQMEDFRLKDTYYHYERHHSIHPAYPFKMSARDMARFGLLFLNKGTWNRKRIIPGTWVRESTAAHSAAGWRRGNYGYMWWVSESSPFKKLKMFSALGAGGHRIDVLPGADLVFVHRADTYKRKRVDGTKSLRLLNMILDAKISKPKPIPKLLPFPGNSERTGIKTIHLDAAARAKYVNKYKLDSGYWAYITSHGNELWIYFPEIGNFRLLPVSERKFILEDFEVPMFVEIDADGNPASISIHFSSRQIEKGSPGIKK